MTYAEALEAMNAAYVSFLSVGHPPTNAGPAERGLFVAEANRRARVMRQATAVARAFNTPST